MRIAALALSLLVVAGCASTTEPVRQEVGSLEARLARLGLEAADLVDPTFVSPDMAAWVRGQVPERGLPENRVRALLEAVVGKEGLDLRYDGGFTGTASQVFESRLANCLAFTHLVVGLGRELGLPVYYLGARQQPKYEREGSLVVVWEHVTAGFGPATERLVLQLTAGPQFEYDNARVISNRTALAMHYSNRGAELLRQEDPLPAREMLEIATAIDPQWSHGWVNLGVAKRRNGDLAGAETAYRTALEVDPDHVQAYHNLAALLWLLDRRDAATEILGLLDRRETKDPFVYLSLGDLSRRARRLDEARRFYQRAARLAPESGEPRAALGQVALAQGRTARAERFLRQAERRGAGDERVERLRRALEDGPADQG